MEMEFWGLFNEAGLPLAFYTSDYSGEVPEEAVKITEAQWRTFIDNQGAYRWDGEQSVLIEDAS